MTTYPFRLGTTSYILPDDILPNVRFLAGKVQDIELVLFEADDGPNNLPTPRVVEELAALAQVHGFTFTVHLPLDLRLGSRGQDGHASMIMACRVIECTRALKPWAYVLHLDGGEVKESSDRARLDRWRVQAIRAIELAAEWAGGARQLAVENLEHYPPEFLEPVLKQVPVSRCVDIGHLWLDGLDPLPYLRAALPRTRVIHLHGVANRDHKSLACIPAEKLKPVVDLLLRECFAGVLTLEVFGEEDFDSSIEALERAVREVRSEA